MKNLKTLSKSKMKKIVGGTMDKETWLQWCLDHISANTGDSTVDAILKDLQEDQCYDMYSGMSA
ncbi:MAG: hypothetical protein J7577_23230 [Sphingobacteriaceae bacterium]|nr:hypothetical protein [Sphingobacteriaceae bacterium]